MKREMPRTHAHTHTTKTHEKYIVHVVDEYFMLEIECLNFVFLSF